MTVIECRLSPGGARPVSPSRRPQESDAPTTTMRVLVGRADRSVPPARLERATGRLEGCCSIQLSYGGVAAQKTAEDKHSGSPSEPLTPERAPRCTPKRPSLTEPGCRRFLGELSTDARSGRHRSRAAEHADDPGGARPDTADERQDHD